MTWAFSYRIPYYILVMQQNIWYSKTRLWQNTLTMNKRLHAAKWFSFPETSLLVVNLTDMTHYAYKEVVSPVPGISLLACFAAYYCLLFLWKRRMQFYSLVAMVKHTDEAWKPFSQNRQKSLMFRCCNTEVTR